MKSLESLRRSPKVNGNKLVIDSLELFKRLIIIIEREVKTKQALRFEMIPTPMSLLDKDQKSRYPDKAALGRFLKAFVEPFEQPVPCTSLEIDADLGDLRFDIIRKQASAGSINLRNCPDNRSCSAALSTSLSPNQRLAAAANSIIGCLGVRKEAW